MSKTKEIELTQELAKELLDYDPGTGKLTWKARGRHLFDADGTWHRWNTKNAGKEAGYSNAINSYGYRRRLVSVFCKKYFAHRIIWLWMTGQWPEVQIDHIDRNGMNNKWDNLRDVTDAINSKNLSMNSRNTSGVTGVSWSKHARKWRAQVVVGGKPHILGLFAEEDLDLAAMEVMEFRAKNGFSPTHGTQYAHYHQQKEDYQ